MAELNIGQKTAVESNSKKIVCLAGAGTGKTFCLIRRIARIAQEHDPSEILALTFTQAAAFEMRRRYMELCPNVMIPEFRTFHSFCYHLLSDDPAVLEELGYKSIPVIADIGVAKKLEHDVSQAMNFKAVESKVKSGKRLTPKEQHLYMDYKKRLRKCYIQKNSITFNDLSESVCNLFKEDASCIQKYKKQFKYIFVDEFQDTDPIEYDFVSSFEDSNIFVVGDSLQSIYGFRGASPEIIQNLASDSDWETIRLDENYRSTKEIIAYANQVSDHADDSYRVELHADRSGKNVTIHRWNPDSSGLDYEEMCDIVDLLNSVEGTSAILACTNNEVSQICHVLDNKGVEYTCGKKDTDPENFVNAMRDPEFAADWLSSLLSSNNYAQYIRLCRIESDKTPMRILEVHFTNDYNIRYRLLTLQLMRNTMLSRMSPVDKLNRIFELIGHGDIKYDSYPSGERLGDVILNELAERESKSVYVGTVHSSKGLEYDNVFLVGLGSCNFSLNTDESKNIRYVGVTRAKNVLHVYYDVDFFAEEEGA